MPLGLTTHASMHAFIHLSTHALYKNAGCKLRRNSLCAGLSSHRAEGHSQAARMAVRSSALAIGGVVFDVPFWAFEPPALKISEGFPRLLPHHCSHHFDLQDYLEFSSYSVTMAIVRLV